MTRQQVINDIFGNSWTALDDRQTEIAEKIFNWMYSNFGLTGEEINSNKKIISAIQLAVLDAFGMSYDQIMSKCRKRELVDKRAMIYKIANDMSVTSHRELAKEFPKDRCTTIYHGVRVANTLIEVDADFKANYEKLKSCVEKYYNLVYEEE